MNFVTVVGPQNRLKFKTRIGPGPVSQTVSDEIVLREAFEENTYALHEDHFLHTGIMVDIGANIGAVTILACELGAKRVVAYEPDPENYALLKENVALNSGKIPVELHQQAVWSFEGTIPLVPSQGASTSRSSVVERYAGQVVMVTTITLAQVLQPFPEVDVVKVDTEGAEYEMFVDRETNQKIRMLVMEYHQTTAERFGALVALLSLTHNLQLFGHYDTDGGQILAKRYGD